jgi:transposase InsO family protein
MLIEVEHRRPTAGLIHHSDQGIQYASSGYRLRLEEAAMLRACLPEEILSKM